MNDAFREHIGPFCLGDFCGVYTILQSAEMKSVVLIVSWFCYDCAGDMGGRGIVIFIGLDYYSIDFKYGFV